ncbi:MAG: hypothetical protein KatS3mg080_0341 [Anoxybacillus sp.]|nr:MAG: hypothetical protein KatS3mg080_0341 [Anoxybacillus sp.]
MLMPKRVKYRREHRGRMKGRAKGGTEVHFGEFGLQALRASMDHKPSNRGGSSCDDSLHETWR